MNATQKRLFEEARKRNPNLKVPTETQPSAELTDDDLALIKQGVGDKTSRPSSASGGTGAPGEETSEFGVEQTGAIVKYFDEKGFGFIRPDNGGRDVFFHVSRLTEGLSTDLIPNARVGFELGQDRTGKTAASAIRILPAVTPEPAA